MKTSRWILPIIVISQFCCTSLWFAGNGIMGDLVSNFNLDQNALGHLTSAVQFGFIIGTLIFAFLMIADRFSPSSVFFVCAIVGGIFNIGIIVEINVFWSLILLRFLTGFFLAGIYPVGMKIAADYFEKGLGKSLGYLVGALVLGTAFPHFLKGFNGIIPWEYVIFITSGLAFVGGVLMILLVPNGPYRKSSQKMDMTALFKIFKVQKFRSAAFGYFGHMWELYAFWAFIPIILTTYNSLHPSALINIPLWSFLIIGIGSISCVLGGYLSLIYGTKKIASLALIMSGVCCLISPLFFIIESNIIFIGFLLFWGMMVIADSPLFSTLVAHNTIAESKGTALTIVNSIGFAITIISIQLLGFLYEIMDPSYIYIVLAVGPFVGLLALYERKDILLKNI